MNKTLKKHIVIILSAVISILSTACSSAPGTADISDSLSISAEPTADLTSETAALTTISKENETETAAPSSSSENSSKTEESSDTNLTVTETVPETTIEPETALTAEIPETTLQTAPPVTNTTPETTAAQVSSTTAKPETTTLTTTEAVATAAQTSAATTAITSVETTVSETTANTTVSETTADTTANTTEPEENKPTLSNPNASPEAQKLYLYISDTYGKGIISGQQESTWMGSEQYEFDYIFEKTGKYPAIRGLDYMNDDFRGVNRRAAEWHDRGGIVTICWHCGCDFGGSWSECMNTELKDWNAALTEGTEEYKALIAGMDKAAKALKELKDQNIPVLWRPFHELDGGWFWWSKGGADNFKKLWIIMYDRYTNYWGLDNLIWVCGFSGNGVNYDKWYPGDAYVDIAGADSYNDGANARLYKLVTNIVGEKIPVCFQECGRIPTVDQLRKDKANWVWFMTWHTDHITSGNDVNDLKAIFNDPYVITLDELPDLR